MTEQQQPKGLTIKIDQSEIVKEKEAKIQELSQKLGKMEEINRAFLAKDANEERQKAIYVNSPRDAPIGGDTAPLDYDEKHVFKNVDFEASDIDPAWIYGKTEAEAVSLCVELAKKGNKTAKNMLDKLNRKLVHSPIDMTFTGSNINFVRPPIRLTPYQKIKMEESEIAKVEKFNKKLAENRMAWVNTKNIKGEND